MSTTTNPPPARRVSLRGTQPRPVRPVSRGGLAWSAFVDARRSIPALSAGAEVVMGELRTGTVDHLAWQVTEHEARLQRRLTERSQSLQVGLAANRSHRSALQEHLDQLLAEQPPDEHELPAPGAAGEDVLAVRSARRLQRWRAEHELACAQTGSEILGLDIEAEELRQALDSLEQVVESQLRSYTAYSERRLSYYWDRLCRRHAGGARLAALRPALIRNPRTAPPSANHRAVRTEEDR